MAVRSLTQITNNRAGTNPNFQAIYKSSDGKSNGFSQRESASKYDVYLPDDSKLLNDPQNTSPVYDQFSLDNDKDDLLSHAFQHINKFKTCELCFGWGLGGQYLSPSSNQWGNWRESFGVSDNVLLYLENPVMSFGYTHSLSAAWDEMKPGFLNQIEGALEMARIMTGGGQNSVPQGGKFISLYHEVPQWKGTTPVKLSSTIKFNFEFGQAGIFSGEHEVVRPILSLASQLLPYGAGGTGNYLKGPAPTKSMYVAMMAQNLKGKMGDLLETATTQGKLVVEGFMTGGQGAAASDLVSAATTLQDAVYSAIDQGIKDGAATGLRTIYIRMGRLVCGPYACRDISWDFDFNETDEYGFPYKGSVTFGGLDSLYVATSGSVIQVFNAT
jgi:hypothetical protein